MLNLEWIWEPRNRTVVLLASVSIVLGIAAVDWWTKPYVSLGFLYLFPIMLAAGFLPRWGIVLMGLGCALLSERFSNLDPADAPIRLSFEALALVGSGWHPRSDYAFWWKRVRQLSSRSMSMASLNSRTVRPLNSWLRGMGICSDSLSRHSCPNCITHCAGKRDHSSGHRCNAGAIEETGSRSWLMSGFPVTKKGRPQN